MRYKYEENKFEKEKTTETKESKKKGSGDPPGVTEKLPGVSEIQRLRRSYI